MRALVISPNYPYPPDKGDRIRSAAICTALAKIYTELDLICLDSRIAFPPIPDLKVKFTRVHNLSLPKVRTQFRLFVKSILFGQSLSSTYFFHHSLSKLISDHLEKQDYQLVFVISSAFDYLLPILKYSQVPLYWDLTDYDSEKWRQLAQLQAWPIAWLYRRESRLIANAEEEVIRQANKIFIISATEKEKRPANNFSNRIHVLPALIELPEPIQSKQSSEILFLGQMDYLPNIRAVDYFANQVFPIIKRHDSNWKFTVVGRGVPDSLIKRCPFASFTGEVVDIDEYLKNAELMVAPMLDTFGVPNKVLIGMAAGIPVLITQSVAKALGVQHKKEVWIAQQAADYLAAIKFYRDHPDLKQEIIFRAREFVSKNHSLEKLISVLKN